MRQICSQNVPMNAQNKLQNALLEFSSSGERDAQSPTRRPRSRGFCAFPLPSSLLVLRGLCDFASSKKKIAAWDETCPSRPIGKPIDMPSQVAFMADANNSIRSLFAGASTRPPRHRAGRSTSSRTHRVSPPSPPGGRLSHTLSSLCVL